VKRQEGSSQNPYSFLSGSAAPVTELLEIVGFGNLRNLLFALGLINLDFQGLDLLAQSALTCLRCLELVDGPLQFPVGPPSWR